MTIFGYSKRFRKTNSLFSSPPRETTKPSLYFPLLASAYLGASAQLDDFYENVFISQINRINYV